MLLVSGDFIERVRKLADRSVPTYSYQEKYSLPEHTKIKFPAPPVTPYIPPPEPPTPEPPSLDYVLLHYWDMVAGSGTDNVVDIVGGKDFIRGYSTSSPNTKPSWGRGYLEFTAVSDKMALVSGTTMTYDLFPQNDKWSLSYWISGNIIMANPYTHDPSTYTGTNYNRIMINNIEIYGNENTFSSSSYEQVCVDENVHIFTANYTIGTVENLSTNMSGSIAFAHISGLESSLTNRRALNITQNGDYVYLLTTNSYNGDQVIFKISKSTYSIVTSGVKAAGTSYWGNMYADGTYLYVLRGSTFLDRWQCSDMTYVDTSGVPEGASCSSMDMDDDYIYFMDSDNNAEIIKVDRSTGAVVARTGEWGNGDGYDGNDQFGWVYGIGVDDTYLYVCDGDNYRIQKRLKSDLSFVSEKRDSTTEWVFTNLFLDSVGYTYNVCGKNGLIYLVHDDYENNNSITVYDDEWNVVGYKCAWGWWEFPMKNSSTAWNHIVIVSDPNPSSLYSGILIYYNGEFYDRINGENAYYYMPGTLLNQYCWYLVSCAAPPDAIGPIALFSGMIDQSGVTAMYESGRAAMGLT